MDYENTAPSEVIEGHIENVIYRNEENGWTVFSVSADHAAGEESRNITCTATLPETWEGELVRMTGFFVVHPTYGRQFKAVIAEKSLPVSEAGVLRYLSSGAVKGIGAKLAVRIITKFGKDTLTIMEFNPEKLAGVRGLSLNKAMDIGRRFAEGAEERRAVLFLQAYDITAHMAAKIYNKYKDATINTVRENPYALCEDVQGIGFRTADGIAARVGVPADSPFRIRAAARYILFEATSAGHVYLPAERLIDAACELLGLQKNIIEDEIGRLKFERVLWSQKLPGAEGGETEALYLNAYYYAEVFAAKKLFELANFRPPFFEGDEKQIAAIEAEQHIKLAGKQREAVLCAMRNSVMIITGGPGTGKTTTINTIIKLFQKADIYVELAAPTGRAAKRIQEATGIEASTIHRLLGIGADNVFTKDDADKLDCGALIIDEASMVDAMLLYRLLNAIDIGTRLIFVGDVDQLPSVGAGNVLKDMITSGILPVERLNEVFRQASKSAIILNAHKINNGVYPALDEKHNDFFFMRRSDIDSCVATVVELAAYRLPKYVGARDKSDVQVLTPTRKGPLGVASLNIALQAAINPPAPYINEIEFKGGYMRAGDKVMQIKNNYNLNWRTSCQTGVGVFNGDEGIVKAIDEKTRKVTIEFDGERLVDYDFTNLEELELSYAVTIHKSQGTEYKAVVIPLHSGPPLLLSRNLLYTAITRAKQLAVIVGRQDCVYRMVDNDKEVARFTALAYRLARFGVLSAY